MDNVVIISIIMPATGFVCGNKMVINTLRNKSCIGNPLQVIFYRFDWVAPDWCFELDRLWRRTILLCIIISGDYSFLLFADGGTFVMKVSSFAVFINNNAV